MSVFIIIIIAILIAIIVYLNQRSSRELQIELSRSRLEQNQILSNAINMMESKVNANHDLASRSTSNSNQEILNMINQLQNNLSKEVQVNSRSNQEINQNMNLLKGLYQQIDNLEGELNSLSRILDDKQLRGVFGERRLSQILEQNYGIASSLYEEQVLLSNGKRADVIINYPNNLKRIVIDAKFPLENYRRLIANDDEAGEKHQRNFINDVKKHINDIHNKYIIANETAPSAMMFIPSESVYYQLLKLDEQIIDYAYKRQVWIVSPTTIMAILTSLDVALKDVNLNQNLVQVRNELVTLGDEFKRYEQRFANYNQRLQQMEQEREKLNITSQKLIKKFNELSMNNHEKY